MKKIQLAFLIFSFTTILSAQKMPYFSIGAEFGLSSSTGNLSNKWSPLVRQDVGSYSYYGDYSGTLSGKTKVRYWGIKPSYTFWNERVSLYSGLRFTHIESVVNGGNSKSSYFFLRNRNTPTSSEFVRVTKLTDATSYLCIPFEISYVPIKVTRVSFTVKVGADIGIKLTSNKNVNFFTESMNIYKNDILNTINIPSNRFLSTVYCSAGIWIKLTKMSDINIEFPLLGRFNTEDSSSLISLQNFFGTQVSIRVPLRTK